MRKLIVTAWSEGCSPSECGIQVDGTRYSTEDLDEITSREDAEAAGISTALLDEYRGNWGLFGVWLEDRAFWGGPKTPAAGLQEFSQRLRVRQSPIRIAMAKLLQPEPRSVPRSSQPRPSSSMSAPSLSAPSPIGLPELRPARDGLTPNLMEL